MPKTDRFSPYARAMLGLGVVALLLSACAATVDPSVQPAQQSLVVTVHSVPLTVGAEQQGQQTAPCDVKKGEHLVSGGYLASAVRKPTDQNQEVEILNSNPSDGAGNAPNSQTMPIAPG